MSFEERIAALPQRHEALTMHLELMVRDTEDMKASILDMKASLEALQTSVIAHSQQIAALITITQGTDRNMQHLINIVKIHEHRLQDLED